MLLNSRFGEGFSAIKSLPPTIPERFEGRATCCQWAWEASMTIVTGLALSNMSETFSLSLSPFLLGQPGGP